MFSKRIAKVLDSAAAKAYETGTKVAGDKGGDTADRLMSAAFGGLRDRLGHDCTRPDCKH